MLFSKCVQRSASRVSRMARTATIRRFASQSAEAANNSGGGGGGMGMPVAVFALAASGYVYYDTKQDLASLQDKTNDLQVQLSGKTNSAYVFIKPHACKGTPGSVESLVESKLRQAGIRLTGKGTMEAQEIDEKMYIDTHYGAIASKAVKLQPSQLNVPDKGKAGFQAMFGETWESALDAGKVYNAKDAVAKLGITTSQLNDQWSRLTRGKNLIKFGGGFYCGKIGDIYVMNGFYMSMRASYCSPGEKIHWYTVSWPADSLSWEDFRGQVLGATDPTAAPKGSIRREILDQYKKLGLSTKPNTGDNGVHASASPFEALAERVNWLGVDPETDDFGKGLLAAGVSKETIQAWSEDSQVSVEGETAPGKTMSVFDTLEDLDADDVLAKVSRISK